MILGADQCKSHRDTYITRITLESIANDVRPLFLTLLSLLSPNLDYTNAATILIGNIVAAAIANRPTML